MFPNKVFHTKNRLLIYSLNQILW